MNGLRRFLNSGLIAGFALSLLSYPKSYSYEIDNFTDRDVPRQDAIEVMDHEVNLILERAALEVNKESKKYCSFAHLRSEILRWIRPDPAGLLEIWANNTDQIEHVKIDYKDSIYGDVTLFDSPALWFVGIGRSMRLAGTMVGTDKVGHFFMQGLDYYDRAKSGKPLDRILAEDHGEDGVWGLTGVYSYADMSANYAGYQFWNSLIRGDQRYFKCVYGKGWVKQRQFTWKDYVNDAWDEGINCSEMQPAVKERVKRRLSQLSMTCPVDPVRCANLNQMEKSQFIVSPYCRSMAHSTTPALHPM